MKRNIFRYCLSFLLSFISISGFYSCEKYLDKKAVVTDVVPSTLDDLQALLNNTDLTISRSSGITELNADNYYITSEDYHSFNGNPAALFYIWDKNNDDGTDWNYFYTGPVYYSNIVLDYLPRVKVLPGEANKYNQIKGIALFYRSFAFYELSQIYCRPYSSNANTDLGIVLKTTSSINETVTRVSVQETYNRIISDLNESITLLPDEVTVPVTRPSKIAAHALLARVYLSMRDYQNAGLHADSSLLGYDVLMNYNNLIPVQYPPVRSFNPEVIFHAYVSNIPAIIAGSYVPKIDSLLYQSYDQNDLRKTVFFTSNGPDTYGFQGSYHGSLDPSRTFTGLTTGELYLIRAESQAKAGNLSASLTDLNDLMKTRWLDGQFNDITALTAVEALEKIRAERRKELIFRGQRWSDLYRYNLEDSAITLKRIIDGVSYTLPPNDNRWQILIPWSEVDRAGIIQNPR